MSRRFLLAAGAFGDSLNHAYKLESEAIALEFLYGLDNTSELSVKAKSATEIFRRPGRTIHFCPRKQRYFSKIYRRAGRTTKHPEIAV